MVEIMAPKSGVLVSVFLDDEDAARLPGKVSIGSHDYAQIFVDKRVTLLHRWILGLSVGDGKIGDYRDRDHMNCRRSNLRIVTHAMNGQNTSGWGASGLRGVYLTRCGRWQAKAEMGGQKYYLGTYGTAEEAYAVSSAWRQAHMPGFVVR